MKGLASYLILLFCVPLSWWFSFYSILFEGNLMWGLIWFVFPFLMLSGFLFLFWVIGGWVNLIGKSIETHSFRQKASDE